MSSQTYPNVSQACWNCVQQSSMTQHGTVYDPPPPATQGISTTVTPVGDVKLSFDYQAAAQTVVYTIISKPWIVTESEIWNGIIKSIHVCVGG
jgi:hypothetical protein